MSISSIGYLLNATWPIMSMYLLTNEEPGTISELMEDQLAKSDRSALPDPTIILSSNNLAQCGLKFSFGFCISGKLKWVLNQLFLPFYNFFNFLLEQKGTKKDISEL